jgi:two-component system, NtrC family, sensor histidine kinase KinB
MLKLYTTSLRSKILLGYTVILLIMFFASLWSIYNFYRVNESIKFTMQDNYSSVIAADNMGRALDEQLHALVIMLNLNFEEGDKIFENNENAFYSWYTIARNIVSTVEEKNILDSLNTNYDKFKKDISRIDYRIYIRIKSQELKNDFILFVNDIKELKRKTNRLIEINHTQLSNSVSSVKDFTQTATILIIFSLVGAIGISLVFGSKFSDYIVKPIEQLRESVKHISDRNFKERIEVDAHEDEIGGLAEDFNKMSEKLQNYEELNVSKILYEKKKSELTIESMNEPVIMIDENYNLVLSNKMFNEVFGENLSDTEDVKKFLTAKQLPKSSDSQVNKYLYQNEDVIKVKDKDGIQKYYKIIGASLAIPETEMKGTVIVFNDITKYQELDRMKSEFVAKVSHELKTPLTSLGMALGIIEDKVVGELSIQQGELIASMKEDYERLNRLVYEILELTKLESNIDRIKFEKFEAQKLADHISKKFTIQAKEKNISLHVLDSSSGAMINGSYDNIISAIENLVSNSLRFTPQDGEINVSFSLSDENLIIEISDTGIGISPDNLKKIFDKFIQIDDNSPGSLGLGLSIAKEVIEIHNGEIKAFSDLGKGSTFQIKLPVV